MAARFLGLFGSVVRWVGLVFALVLVVQVVFVVGEANRDNGIVSFIANVSRKFALGFKDLFTPDDPKLAVLVNYGIAALFWLIVSAVAARITRRIAMRVNQRDRDQSNAGVPQLPVKANSASGIRVRDAVSRSMSR